MHSGPGPDRTLIEPRGRRRGPLECRTDRPLTPCPPALPRTYLEVDPLDMQCAHLSYEEALMAIRAKVDPSPQLPGVSAIGRHRVSAEGVDVAMRGRELIGQPLFNKGT